MNDIGVSGSEYAPYKMDNQIFSKSKDQMYSESLKNYCL